jgi:DNA-binding MarR family transcriptional regulator
VLRREVSQEDARRTLVALTDDGVAWLDRMDEVKHEVIGQILADWSHEDLELFSALYERFVEKFEQHAAANGDGDSTGED